MSMKNLLVDGEGSGRKASVTPDLGLLTHTIPYPPLGQQKVIPFRQYLTLDGTSTGSSDMRVAGSAAAPITFHVPAHPTSDRYITQVSFLLADAGATLTNFGNIAALTNGCRFYYSRLDGEIEFHSALKTSFDIIRMCLFNPSFGAAADVWRATNVSGASEGYVPTLNLLSIMPPFGVKLDVGTKQKLAVAIRDSTTGVDAFNAIVYGFDRLA